MAEKFTGLSTKRLNEIMQSPAIRAALRKRMERALPRTRAIALQHDAPLFAEALRIEEGTRPGTKAEGGLRRPYARLIADITPEMKRKDSRRLSRKQILRRGAL